MQVELCRKEKYNIMFVTGIDVGNFDTKSPHTTIASGYQGPFKDKPPIVNSYLFWDGKYYIPSNERFPYEKDKTKSERCIVLTLFSLANEIYNYVMQSTQNVQKNKENIQNLISTIKEVGIGVGLPPTHYIRERVDGLIQYYKDYMGNGIKFTWNDYAFEFTLKACKVYPQGGAGATSSENTFKRDYSLGYFIVDIGGYTVDVIKMVDNRPNGKYSSKEIGVITMFDEISNKIQLDYDITIGPDVIEAVLKHQKNVLELTSPDAIEEIKRLAKVHMDMIIDTLRQLGVEFKAYPCLFMGGGSLLLKEYILENSLINQNAALFLNNPCENAIGYQALLAKELKQR